MAPKKKGQKMALNAFFADTTGGDWADEMDNLPTAPAPKDPNAGPQRGEPGYLDAMPDRSSRAAFGGPPREELPIPNAPPYTAFVGNMAFEVDEEALKGFFSAEEPVTARVMKDAQGAMKGHGYVEFPTGDKLRAALDKSGTNLLGRTIRVSVAEPPSSKGRDFAPSAADEASQWRRSGPLPARDPPPSARRQGSYNDAGAPGAGGGGGGGGERDWGAARGARFTPSVPPTPSGLRRDSSGPGRERSFEPSQADEAGQWRSSRPMADVTQAQAPQRPAFSSGQSSPGLADTEQTWSRGTKLKTPVLAQEPSSGTGSPAEERDWRSSRATSAVPSNDGGDSPRQAPAPLERRKLNLAPRSASTVTSPTEPNGPTSSKSSNIFGAAKPIDTATKEREAAEKQAAKDEQRLKDREEEVKREEEKSRKVLEDRQRSIKEAQDKANAEILGQKAPASAPAQQGSARSNSHGGQGRPQGSRAPSSGNAWGKPAQAQAQAQGQGQGQGQQKDAQGQQKKRPERKVGEDGFEVATSGRGAKAPVERPQVTKKESTTRSGFSFAAAAGSAGLVQDEEGDESGVNANNEKSEDVAEVTNGVKEVTV